MEDLIGTHVQTKEGLVPVSELSKYKYVLLYFSAHWCPPCRGFTPKLGMFYDSVNEDEKKVEVVFVSADRTPEQFNEYYDEMDWAAIPFTETAKRAQLAQKFKIQGLPVLFLIDRNGNMVRDTCRMDVTSKGPVCLSDWDNALS